MKYLAAGAMLLLAFLSIVPLSGAEPDKASAWRRWAIIATPEVRESGISDLLTARLSEADSIELVEREQLDRALQELELAAQLGVEGTRQRLQLGKLLKADALVLLSVRRHQGLLSDTAIVHLSKLPHLIALKLVGQGFADDALKHLKGRRRMRELLLHDTRITPAGIAQLKQSLPSLQIPMRDRRSTTSRPQSK